MLLSPVALFSLLLTVSTARLISEEPTVSEDKSVASEDSSCEVHGNPSLHVIMDRVCEICHEMISHQQPNMRATCRSNCFRNDQFRSCLKLFSPHRPNRHARF